MNLLERVQKEIAKNPNNNPDHPPLIDDMALEWHGTLGNELPVGHITVYTRRNLELNGGNGWNGVDAQSFNLIRSAIRDTLDADGNDLIKTISVRPANRQPAIN